MQDLGELGGHYSNAVALNSTGTEIVGYSAISITSPTNHAFIYRNGRMSDLNSLVPRATGWVLVAANSIDDTGVIVGYGMLRGEQRAFMLTPVSR